MPFNDLTGQTFGRLTVVSLASTKRTRWNCVRSCGKETIALASNLKAGTTQSCGCLSFDRNAEQIEQLEGQQFGRLTVTRLASRGPTKFWCSCSCGTELIVGASSLKSGNTRSCGCLRSDVASEKMKRRGNAEIVSTEPLVCSELIWENNL